MPKEKEIKNNSWWQKIKAENPERYQELLDNNRQYQKERLQWLDKNGYCHKCGKNKQLGDYKFCTECLEKIQLRNIKNYDPVKAHNYQARRREIYKYKKEHGICVRCSKPAKIGMYCTDCYIKQKRRLDEKCRKAKEKRQERGLIPEYRKANNLCFFCGEPVEEPKKHGRACNKCAERCSENAIKQENNYFRKTNAAMYGRYNCGGIKILYQGTRLR